MAAEYSRRRYPAGRSAAYAAPGFDGTAARQLERERVAQPRPKVRPREQVQVRPRVRVRQQEPISIFAVVGFLAVGVLAALLLIGYAQLTQLNDEVVSLRNQAAKLQEIGDKLQTQYELTYDLKTIEETVLSSGAMVRPQSGQIYTIEMAEPDRVVRFEEEKTADGFREAVSAIREVFTVILEYFR